MDNEAYLRHEEEADMYMDEQMREREEEQQQKGD